MKAIKFMLAVGLVMYLLFSLSNLTLNYLEWTDDSRLLCSVLTSVIYVGYFMFEELNRQTK